MNRLAVNKSGRQYQHEEVTGLSNRPGLSINGRNAFASLRSRREARPDPFTGLVGKKGRHETQPNIHGYISSHSTSHFLFRIPISLRCVQLVVFMSCTKRSSRLCISSCTTAQHATNEGFLQGQPTTAHSNRLYDWDTPCKVRAIEVTRTGNNSIRNRGHPTALL
jgi:hypothetical protein